MRPSTPFLFSRALVALRFCTRPLRHPDRDAEGQRELHPQRFLSPRGYCCYVTSDFPLLRAKVRACPPTLVPSSMENLQVCACFARPQVGSEIVYPADLPRRSSLTYMSVTDEFTPVAGSCKQASALSAVSLFLFRRSLFVPPLSPGEKAGVSVSLSYFLFSPHPSAGCAWDAHA